MRSSASCAAFETASALELEAHLRGCAGCREQHAALRKLRAALGAGAYFGMLALAHGAIGGFALWRMARSAAVPLAAMAIWPVTST